MSRSYRKVGGLIDRNPWAKKYANRRLRHMKDVPSGNAFKKFTDPYEICDFGCPIFSRVGGRIDHEIWEKNFDAQFGWKDWYNEDIFNWKEYKEFGK